LNEYSKEKAVFQKKLIIVFTKALEYYDTYTKGHSVNVANYASKISEKLGFESERISKIYWAGLVHDVGKIFVPQSVLNKSEKLTDEEYELIKLHPLKGYELISEIEGLKDIAEIVLYHHERYDGKGYPYGKKGDEIPIESRILCVADSFDAMTSDRPYKKSLTLEEAIEELRKNSGTQFDPEIVSVLIDILLSEFNHRSSMNA
jgi:polar amino acid transport system substrate-binding protein